jgi:hypothetical protein
LDQWNSLHISVLVTDIFHLTGLYVVQRQLLWWNEHLWVASYATSLVCLNVLKTSVGIL